MPKPPPGLKTTFAIGGQEFLIIGRSNRPVVPRVLSSAEGMIYQLLVAGLSKSEIAEKREATSGTISNQLRSIYRKLNVAGRTELLAKVTWQDDDKDNAQMTTDLA